MPERVDRPAPAQSPPSNRWPDVGRLALLFILALVLRTWVIRHTEVGARDSIGFIRYALQFDEAPWTRVVKKFEQHPAYPLVIWAVSVPVRSLAGGLSCDAMLLSAQIASLLASLLTIVPIYYLGKTLFNRDAGFLAAALWQCLPVCLHVTADGLSEATFLMFISWSLYFAIQGFRKPAAWWFVFCGFAGGLAYLTRPEGVEAVAAAGLILMTYGLAAWGWRATAGRGLALAAGALPCLALYVTLTGHLTNKPTGQDVINGHPRDEAVPTAQAIASPLVFASFWNPQFDAGQSREAWAAKTLVFETVKSAHYFSAAFALLGLWWYRARVRSDPGLWLLLILSGMHALLLWRMAVVIGYLSERHTLPIVLLGTLWAGAAIALLGRKLSPIGAPVSRFAPAALGLLVMAAGIPSSLKPLHANRAGHHAAGVWIAMHGSDADEVVDPFCWAHFYAGCVFREGKVVPPPQRVRYVVVEQSSNPHARLPLMAQAREMSQRGECVYHWPEQKSPEKATVVVFRVPAGK